MGRRRHAEYDKRRTLEFGVVGKMVIMVNVIIIIKYVGRIKQSVPQAL